VKVSATLIDTVPTIFLTTKQTQILEAQLLDGGDTETVAARARVGRNYANKVLSDIAGNFDMRRMEMVVAFIKGQIAYVTI